MTQPFDLIILLKAANDVAVHAYAPYSKYKVGAALLAKSGTIHTGCNVENASYGLTQCAERVAVFNALSQGEKTFEALVICSADGAYPCGACRQVLHEFNPGLRIFLSNRTAKTVSEVSLRDLLPNAFGPTSLDEG